MSELKMLLKIVLPTLIISGCIALAMNAWYIVDPGYTSLHIRLGKVVDVNKNSGWYLKAPFIDSIIYINNRICKSEIETAALSKDLQFTQIGVAINYKIEDAYELYRTVGTDFDNVIINPYAQESIKAVVAKYTAEDLIRCRHEAKNKVYEELKDRLAPLNITLIDFNFVHLDFSPEFIKAVEDKQIAQQSAMTAKNITEKVKEEAVQTKAQAEAEAYALTVRKNALTPELIKIKAIEKWDGVLPKMMSGSVPFINVGNV